MPIKTKSLNNVKRILFGLAITIVIFFTARTISKNIPLNSKLVPDTFISLTIILLLSTLAIYIMRQSMTYSITLPKLKTLIKPILLGLGTTIIINVFMTIVTKLTGGKNVLHPAFLKLNWIQILVFVFVYASIVEEILFRGFLLNYLKPLKSFGVRLFKRKISLPVFISALAFGAAHLTLISTGVGYLFVFRIVLFATCLGIIAGYYQEKYDNNAYAIAVHMAGNSIAVIGTFLIAQGFH